MQSQDTIVCVFDSKCPRISVLQIHKWIYEQLHLRQEEVRMVQLDGSRRLVFIKFNNERMQEVIRTTQRQLEFHHENGELSLVQVDIAGLGLRRVRIANLPPEVPDRMLRETMSKYGTVKGISEQSQSKAYRYPVSNGIRIVELSLKLHIPSITYGDSRDQSTNIL